MSVPPPDQAAPRPPTAPPPPPPPPTAVLTNPPPPPATLAPRLPSAPPFVAAPPEQGRIPPQFYDPALLNRPLKQRRSVFAWLVRGIAVFGAIAIVAAVGYGVYIGVTEQNLPSATTSPAYRSSTFKETSRAPGGDLATNYVATISGDAVDRVITVEFDQAGLTGWIGTNTHVLQADGTGAWYEYANEPADSDLHDNTLAIIDGLTIDEVLPRAAREYTDIIDVEREQMFGEDVRKFTTQVNVGRMASANPTANSEFEAFWGPTETGSAPASAPVNVTIWVNDDGVVYQVESKSDFDDSLFRLTFVEFSTTAPYSPEYPTDVIPAG